MVVCIAANIYRVAAHLTKPATHFFLCISLRGRTFSEEGRDHLSLNMIYDKWLISSYCSSQILYTTSLETWGELNFCLLNRTLQLFFPVFTYGRACFRRFLLHTESRALLFYTGECLYNFLCKQKETLGSQMAIYYSNSVHSFL